MGMIVYSLSWVMQDLYHQPWCNLGKLFLNAGVLESLSVLYQTPADSGATFHAKVGCEEGRLVIGQSLRSSNAGRAE